MAVNDQNDKRANILTAIIVLVIVFVIGSVIYIGRTGDGGVSGPEAEALASCLTEKGAKMYGASWCAHCAEQKKLFGAAFAKIDYVECAVPGNPQEQTPACKDAGVKSYPTWVFADKSRLSGAIPLKELAAKAGCPFAAGQQVQQAPAPAVNAPSLFETVPVNAPAPDPADAPAS